MSTRATYHFYPVNYTPAATFYIHYDGYPEGAADYFLAMLEIKNQRGGWADRFFRANELAELTQSHEAHGDTAFQYDIYLENDNICIRCKATERFEKSELFSVVYQGTLDKFINQNLSNHPSLPVIGQETQVMLFRRYRDCIAQIRKNLNNGMYGNAYYSLLELRRIVQRLKLDSQLGDALNALELAINQNRAISNEEVEVLSQAVVAPPMTHLA